MSTANSLREEAREQQRKALKGQPLKKKISYILFYYKVYIAVALIVVIAGSIFVNKLIHYRYNALSVAMVNCASNVEYASYMDEYYAQSGVDDRHQMSIDSTYVFYGSNADFQVEQKFFYATAAGQVDIVIAPKTFFDKYAQMGYMVDLSLVLTDEMKEKYADCLYEVTLDSDHGGATEISGIDITNFSAVVDGGWYTSCEEPVYAAITIESENVTQALDFIEYLRK